MLLHIRFSNMTSDDYFLTEDGNNEVGFRLILGIGIALRRRRQAFEVVDKIHPQYQDAPLLTWNALHLSPL